MQKVTIFLFICFISSFSSCKKTESAVTPSLADGFVGAYTGAFGERTASQFLDQHKLTIKIVKVTDNKVNISYTDDVLYGGKTVNDVYQFELVEVAVVNATELKINENIFIYEDNFKKDKVINMVGKATKNGNSLNLIFENGYFSNNSKQPLYLIKN